MKTLFPDSSIVHNSLIDIHQNLFRHNDNFPCVIENNYSGTYEMFLSHSGTVIRVSIIKMLEHEKEYICKRCKHIFSVKADMEQFYVIPKPTKCPSSDECNSTKFTLLSETGKNGMKI